MVHGLASSGAGSRIFPRTKRHLFAAIALSWAWSATSFHFTPTYASWLNLLECLLRVADREGAQARIPHQRSPQLRDAILAYVDAHNERGKPFTWVKTADEILDKMRRFGLRVQQVHGR